MGVVREGKNWGDGILRQGLEMSDHAPVRGRHSRTSSAIVRDFALPSPIFSFAFVHILFSLIYINNINI